LLFQLIKAVCNFLNTTYVLAYDKKIVANALSSEQTANRYKYIEKIIQLTIDIPGNSEEDLKSYPFSKLDALIADLPQEEFDANHWGYTFRNGFYTYFNNLRNVNRYINIITSKYYNYKQVINIVNF